MTHIQTLIKNQFPFLNRKNNKKFFQSQPKTQRTSRKQISQYFGWLHREVFQKHLTKYSLKLKKIEIVENDNRTENLEVDIKQNLEIPKASKIAMYEQKERSHLSDDAFQNFINAGANFPSLRFARECRTFLNSEFKWIPHTMGKLNYN